jgi:hypothetical protein
MSGCPLSPRASFLSRFAAAAWFSREGRIAAADVVRIEPRFDDFQAATVFRHGE